MAMDAMGVSELADQPVDSLSGGQRQRVWIALVLAQDTDILLLDEPTTYLDIAYQVEILDCLAALNRMKQTTIVAILHDINLSIRYADHIFAMKKGNLVAEGNPKEIITPELMREIYGMESTILTDPQTGDPYVIPRSVVK
jgi:iron complex transport system ATP-binding protein